MTTHKAIREATEEGPFYTAMVAKDDLRALLADLDAKTAEVERETAARREAQEQLYAARERHTAEVKKLQAEIGRLQALRPVAMTPSEVTDAFDSELRASYTDFEAGIRTAELHHHITQKEQGK